jgi:dGTPase
VIANYAFDDTMTAGRVHYEPAHPYRGPFQRDRDRIIHCAAWRRLSEKTQVFTSDLGDYHRTRLTHTLEVTSLARTLARTLRLNEDLAEALALLHDVGHSPFGHTGEELLDKMLENEGGFNHNAQALRVIEKLECRYPEFTGLNLSCEVLDGQRYKMLKKQTPQPHSPLLEVQIVDFADSVSYDSHDADDAIELGFLTTDDLVALALWKRAAAQVRSHWTNLDKDEFRQAVIHALIDLQVSNILETTRRRLKEYEVDSPEMVQRLPLLVQPDNELAEQKRELESFLFDNVYRHPKVVIARREVTAMMRDLFVAYRSQIDILPTRYDKVLQTESENRAVADYLADMTDRSIRMNYHRLLIEKVIEPRTPLQTKK